jgi:hypothetical protein
MNSAEQALLGKWISDNADRSGQYSTLEFRSDGRLYYTSYIGDKCQKIFLTYHVENEFIVTDQPSHPRQERTSFVLTEDGRLELTYRGEKSSYTKSKGGEGLLR